MKNVRVKSLTNFQWKVRRLMDSGMTRSKDIAAELNVHEGTVSNAMVKIDKNYLGEFPVDISKHPEYKKYTATDWAMLFIEKYGQIPDAHHKAWVLDQVARILKGTPVKFSQARWASGEVEDKFTVVNPPSRSYQDWASDMKGDWDEDNGTYDHEYNEGIAP